MDVGQNPVPLVNPKIAGKWMFIPLKMVLIGIDPYPYYCNQALFCCDRNNTQQQICGNRSWHWEIFGGHGVAGKVHELY